MAAAVADYRPAAARAGQDQEGRDAAGDARARARAYRGRAHRARRPPPPRPAAGRLRRRARATARSRTARDKLERKGLDAVVVNDVVARRASASTRPTTRSRSSPRTASSHVPRATKAEVAARDPRRRVEPPFIFGRKGRAADGARRAAAVPSTARRRGGRDGRRGRAAHRGQHPPRRQGARRGARARHRRAARRGPHPRRGLPGRRQDRARARALALDRLPVRARPVHGRPAAGRHRRHQRLQPARGSASSSARARSSPTSCSSTRSTAPRRRRSPACSSACRSATSPSTRLARARAPVPRLRDAEPGRVRGHLPAARGAGRPLHGPALARLPRRRRARPGCSPATRRGDRVLDLEPVADRAEVRRGQDAARRVHASQARCATTSSRCCATRAPTTASSSAPRRAPA